MQEQARDLYEELEKEIKEQNPVTLLYIGRTSDKEEIKRMWREGRACL
jgi:hypothetical protein